MYAKVAVVAALMSLVTASPMDLMRRQDGAGAAGNAGGLAPPTPGPGNCFIARAVYGNYPIVGDFLEAHEIGIVHFDQNPKQADIFVLDNLGQLRLARNPASVASRQSLFQHPLGPVTIHSHNQAKDDPLTCNIDGGLLHCFVQPGDCLYSQGQQLWVGSLAKLGPRNPDVSPVEIAVFGVPCPAGPRPWETWQ